MAAVVLAAGGSSRLGRPKQMEWLEPHRPNPGKGRPEYLLERAVRLAREAGCAPVVVVLGAQAERLEAEASLGDAHLVHNSEWATGLSSSLRAGLQHLGARVIGAVVLPCDQPAITSDHLRVLRMRGAELGRPVASGYAGRKGVPAYLPLTSFAALEQLRGDEGARHLLRSAESLDLPGGELDVDTEQSLAVARCWLATHARNG